MLGTIVPHLQLLPVLCLPLPSLRLLDITPPCLFHLCLEFHLTPCPCHPIDHVLPCHPQFLACLMPLVWQPCPQPIPPMCCTSQVESMKSSLTSCTNMRNSLIALG